MEGMVAEGLKHLGVTSVFRTVEADVRQIAPFLAGHVWSAG